MCCPFYLLDIVDRPFIYHLTEVRGVSIILPIVKTLLSFMMIIEDYLLVVTTRHFVERILTNVKDLRTICFQLSPRLFLARFRRFSNFLHRYQLGG